MSEFARSIRADIELLTEEDLAGVLQVEVRTLVVWRAERRGPDYVKLGKNVFYRRGDVTAWIEQNVVVMRRVR